MDSAQIFSELELAAPVPGNRHTEGILKQEAWSRVQAVSCLVEPPRGSESLPEGSQGASLVWREAPLLDIPMDIEAVLEAFRAVSLDKQADLLAHCGEFLPKKRVCGCGSVRLTRRCGLYRICPDCGERRNRRMKWSLHNLLARYPRPRFYNTPGLRLLTLTIVDGRTLGEAYQHLRDSLTRLYHSAYWRDHVSGWVCSIEAKPSPAQGWHVHAHLVVMSRYLNNQDIGENGRSPLSGAWYKASGDSFITDVQACSDLRGGVQYVLKYITKPVPNATPDQLAEIAKILHKKRFLSMGGVFREPWIAARARAEEQRHFCPECGERFQIVVMTLDELYQEDGHACLEHLRDPLPESLVLWGACE